jgi:cell wall-associated NlpC family hydrolase
MTTQDEVTDILNKLRGLLGEGTPVSAPLPSDIPADIHERLNALPNGLGTVIDAFISRRESQAQISAELAKIDPSLGPVVDQSRQHVEAGREQIDYTQLNYDDRRDQLTPVEGTPMGQMAVLQAKVDAVGNGSNAIRSQSPQAELRKVLVDTLAKRYYEQAKASMGGGMPGGGGGSPGGGTGGGGGSPGGGGGGSPLSALSSPMSSLASAFSPPNSGGGGGAGDGDGVNGVGLPSSVGGSEAGRKVAEIALTKLGKPYVWGATGPNQFDCSGLVDWSTQQATGHSLPRVTYDLIKMGTRINPAEARPGDLVFSNFSNRGPEHVQIALGGGKVVHAPQNNDVVKISTLPGNCIVKRIF